MTWIMIIGLAGLFALALAWPLVRPAPNRSLELRKADLADRFKKEKKRLEADHARGILDDAMIKEAQAELDKRILKDLNIIEQETLSPKAHPIIALATGCLVLGLSLGLYSLIGVPQMPTLMAEHQATVQAQAELDDRVAERRAELTQAITRIQAHIASNPNDLEARIMLARAFFLISDMVSARNVLSQAVVDLPGHADLHALLAEAMILSNQGTIEPAAMAHVRQALDLNPRQDLALYYQGWFFIQNADPNAALAIWQFLVTIAPEDATYLPDLISRIAGLEKALGKAPASPNTDQPGVGAPEISTDDVAAAENMSSEDRQAFIESMVERLAVRLEDTPNDIDGWLRLGRAYTVLNKIDDAKAAYSRILDINPDHQKALDALTALDAQ